MDDQKTTFSCAICGCEVTVEGTELPDDFTCPNCGVGAQFFEVVED